MGFISKKEAAKMLGVPLNYVEKMGIIEPYHTLVIRAFAQEHNLPIFPDIILVGEDINCEEVTCCSCLEEALVEVSATTTGLILPTPIQSKALWEKLKSLTIVLTYGDSTKGYSHYNCDTYEECLSFVRKNRTSSS